MNLNTAHDHARRDVKEELLREYFAPIESLGGKKQNYRFIHWARIPLTKIRMNHAVLPVSNHPDAPHLPQTSKQSKTEVARQAKTSNM